MLECVWDQMLSCTCPEYLNNSAKRQRNENNTKNPIEIMKPETDQRVRSEEEKVGEQTVQE